METGLYLLYVVIRLASVSCGLLDVSLFTQRGAACVLCVYVSVCVCVYVCVCMCMCVDVYVCVHVCVVYEF